MGVVGGGGKLCKDSLEILSLLMSLQARKIFEMYAAHYDEKNQNFTLNFFLLYLTYNVWASTQENLFANNTGADQPAHPRSLISAFVIHFLKSIISKLATSEISVF